MFHRKKTQKEKRKKNKKERTTKGVSETSRS
jgi:hypothetical protein